MRQLSLNGTIICSLTDMTGKKASSQRKVPIPQIGVDIPLKTLVIGLCSLPPAAVFGLIAYFVVGNFIAVLIVMALTVAACYFLFGMTRRDGLQLTVYKSLYDEAKYVSSSITLCSVPVNPYGTPPSLIQTAAVAVSRDQSASIADLFGMYDPQAPSADAKTGPDKVSKKTKVSKSERALVDSIFNGKRR